MVRQPAIQGTESLSAYQYQNVQASCFRNCKEGESRVKKAVVIEPADIKKMLAEKFKVKEEAIIKGQYSYTVMLEDVEEGEENVSNG